MNKFKCPKKDCECLQMFAYLNAAVFALINKRVIWVFNLVADTAPFVKLCCYNKIRVGQKYWSCRQLGRSSGLL